VKVERLERSVQARKQFVSSGGSRGEIKHRGSIT